LQITIRKTEVQDIPSILVLIQEFVAHENLSAFLEISEKGLFEAMFGKDSFVSGLIAFDSETPVAYALFYPTFSSFRGQKSVYLEDIFITKEYRNHGIGNNLLREIAIAGKKMGAVRMDFQVLKSNESAIAFYKKHGALIDEEERHFKFVDTAFTNLLKK